MISGGITAQTRVAGVVGFPIQHSLSPAIHNIWIKESGLNAVYVAFPVIEQGFEDFLGAIRSGAILGANVTLPFKDRALLAADVSGDLARQCGAANLIWRDESGRLFADNTDGAGLLHALWHQGGYRPGTDPLVILGAGGAAKGAIGALLQAGATDIRIVNRTPSRAEGLAIDKRVRIYGWDDIAKAVDEASCIINTTSAGLNGQDLPEIPFERMQSDAIAMDMTYKPLITEFLSRAIANGLKAVDGLEMLIGQARPSFETLFGQPAPGMDVREQILEIMSESAR